MRGDGDGWVFGENGTRHWGKHGAAGLLLRAPSADGEPTVLLQHRALWSHQGGTWALPGGAKDSHESSVHAAVREADEEAGIGAERIDVRGERVTARVPSGWTYTTVVADTPKQLATTPNGESTELRWVPESAVDALPLHPGFAQSWPALRSGTMRLLLDAATARQLAEIAAAVPRTVELPDGTFGWIGSVDAVPDGDAELTGPVALVTADRGLQERLPDSVHVLPPSTVLGWL